MSLSFEQVLAKLQNDRQSGALALATATLQDLYQYLQQTGAISQQNLEAMITKLAEARPSMHALINALSRWQTTLSDSKQHNMQELEVIINALEKAVGQVIQHALPLIQPGMKILVHSRSSLVIALFEQLNLKNTPVEVYATLSAPGHEGRQLASRLSELGVPVTLITDAEMGLVMPDIDLNISGCDCWLNDGYFVNKTGTLLQALAARHHHKPFWVLADSFKNSPQPHQSVTLEKQPASALDLPSGDNIRGLNIWFEKIPTHLISGRIDEQGRHPTETHDGNAS